MNMFNEFQRNVMAGDIIDDRGDVVYIGNFGKGGETDTENCLIRRITRELNEETGAEITRIMYPDGNCVTPDCTWANREKYNYKYAQNK